MASANQERAVAALEAASRIYQEVGRNVSARTVITMATEFKDWLDTEA